MKDVTNGHSVLKSMPKKGLADGEVDSTFVISRVSECDVDYTNKGKSGPSAESGLNSFTQKRQ